MQNSKSNQVRLNFGQRKQLIPSGSAGAEDIDTARRHARNHKTAIIHQNAVGNNSTAESEREALTPKTVRPYWPEGYQKIA